MEKTILGSGKELLNEALRLQKEFKKQNNAIWTVESCLNAVIENKTVITNENAVHSARIVAKSIDNK